MDAAGHYVVVWTGPNRPDTIGLLADGSAPAGTDSTSSTSTTTTTTSGDGTDDTTTVSNQTEYGNWVDASGDALDAYDLNYVIRADLLTSDDTTNDSTDSDSDGPISNIANWLLDKESTSIYSRLIDPPIVVATSAALQDMTIMGTSGDDVIEFIGGPSSSGLGSQSPTAFSARSVPMSEPSRSMALAATTR